MTLMNVQSISPTPAKMMRVRCPSCGEAERVPATAVGRAVQCNRCKTKFRIVGPGSAATARAATPPPLPPLPLPALTSPIAALQQHATKIDPAKVRKRALIGLICGIGLALGGAIITIASYSSASDGGTYLILWGPIVFGIGITLRSAWRLLSGTE